MRKTLLIFQRELKDYFISPIAYIVITTFLLVIGGLFFSSFFVMDQAELRSFFSRLPFTFALVVPIITMRLFSEEFNVGSYELLLTLPVTYIDIILGKFLAAVVFTAGILLPTLSYPIFISFIGNPDWGVVVGGYIGAIFMCAAYSAIGIFFSSVTRNQIIAAILSMVICTALAFIDQLLYFLPPIILDVVAYISTRYHFQNIAKGVVDTRDLIYFCSLVFLGLYATHLAMQEKR
jgi:ABC-2 type transport system permease protein